MHCCKHFQMLLRKVIRVLSDGLPCWDPEVYITPKLVSHLQGRGSHHPLDRSLGCSSLDLELRNQVKPYRKRYEKKVGNETVPSTNKLYLKSLNFLHDTGLLAWQVILANPDLGTQFTSTIGTGRNPCKSSVMSSNSSTTRC